MLKKSGTLVLLLFFSSISLGYSQCSNASGIPVVNEDFGSGTNRYGPSLLAGMTNLAYTADCPQDGLYTITNYSGGCYSDSWHVPTDHTGNPNGYFMLINASYAPSDFFVQTVNGLCAGTTYDFSAWILNMAKVTNQIKPNVTFTIEKADGTILGSYSSGDIAATVPYKWQQYGFAFKTPVGVSSVILRMHNNAPGGTGNDLALDDITFAPLGPPITILINGINKLGVNTVCNSKVSLSAIVGTCYVNNAYQWQSSTDNINWTDIPGANNAIYNFTQNSGTYFYRLAVAENGNINSVGCRTNSTSVAVKYNGAPATASAATIICPGSVFIGPSGKAFTKNGIYTDTIRTTLGCDSIITTINISYCPLPTIPNTFTPNGDGVNDTWNIAQLSYYTNCTVNIYTRWGVHLFSSVGYPKPWDGRYAGKPLPYGVYYYLINLHNDTPLLSGWVLLVR